MVKLHLKKNSIVQFHGENYVTSFDYWTTIPSKEDIREGITHIRQQIALGAELCSMGIQTWIYITINREELEVIEQ